MILNNTKLKSHLKTREFARVYLVFGEEKYLVKNDIEQLMKAFGVEEDSFGYSELPYTATLSELAAAIEATPFMSEYNIVKLVDFNIDQKSVSSKDFDSFIRLVETVPDTTILILAMPTLAFSSPKNSSRKPEPTKRFKKLIEVVDKNGVVLEEEKLTAVRLEKTLCAWASAGGSKMHPAVASRLIRRLGSAADLNLLRMEMRKLTAFADGKEITVEMVESLVPENQEANVYYLFDEITARHTERTMTMLTTLIQKKVEPVFITNVLAGAYCDAYALRVGVERGLSAKDCAKELSLRIPAWRIDKTLSAVRNITTPALRKSIDALTATATDLITVKRNPEIEVEKLAGRLILIAGEKADE